MIAFASRTGNVRSIVSKLQIPNIEIHESLRLTQPFILFTYTDGLGHVPQIVSAFMKYNYQNCRGVIASGNSNFGHEVFCKSATIISEQYNVPVIRKIELRGFQHDLQAIQMFYENEFKLEAAT
jgi:protein involved in ribonucleotide reduction